MTIKKCYFISLLEKKKQISSYLSLSHTVMQMKVLVCVGFVLWPCSSADSFTQSVFPCQTKFDITTSSTYDKLISCMEKE